MAQYVEVNGQTIEFPDGMAAPEIEAAIKANYLNIPKAAAIQAGGALNQIPRQLGLTARYGLEGLANTAQLVTEPIRYFQDKLTPERTPSMGDLVTGERKPKSLPLGMIATQFADRIGLPTPQGANERAVAEATRFVAGGAVPIGVASQGAKMTAGAARQAFEQMAANPLQQLTAAAGGGLASGASREAGGSGWQQGIAAALGTVAGGLTPGAVSSLATRLSAIKAPPMQLEGRISTILRESGMDWSEVPQNVRNQLLADVRRATATGEGLNADALRRLADFRLTGTTPTRGGLTLDPVQITREQNLAKLGANTGDDALQGLARTQNQNNTTLINNLNDLGAGRGNPMRAGQTSIDRVTGRDATMQQNVSQLYNAARDMPGGDIPLRRDQLVTNIYDRLARENKLAFLPKEVSDMIDTISSGTITRNGQRFDVPFDAKVLDNLMTTISTAQRSAGDGNVRAALGIVRNAIDDTPIAPIKTQFGGNQVVTEAGARFLRESDDQAPQFMDALNRARAAARERFTWQESSRPVRAILDGAEPDKIVQRFVVGGSVADARALAQNGDQAALRDALLNHLKVKAVNGATDEVGKFSQSAFNKAMREIGDDKLRIFFSPEEIARLHANGRVASYMQVQPVGSAVNNSNSGALMLGKGYDWLNSVVGSLPGGRTFVMDPLRNIDITLSQRQAQNLTPSLLNSTPRQTVPSLLGPAISMGGLLAAPSPVGP